MIPGYPCNYDRIFGTNLRKFMTWEDSFGCVGGIHMPVYVLRVRCRNLLPQSNEYENGSRATHQCHFSTRTAYVATYSKITMFMWHTYDAQPPREKHSAVASFFVFSGFSFHSSTGNIRECEEETKLPILSILSLSTCSCCTNTY